MTADELWTNETYLAFVARWEADGRAPLPAADWLWDRGFDEFATCWQWAATEADNREKGPRPYRWANGRYYWFTNAVFPDCSPLGGSVPESLYVGHSHNLPADGAETFEDAIQIILERWAGVYGTATPEREAVGT